MYCEASAVSGSRALPLSGAASRLSEPAVGEQAAAHVRGAKNKLQLTWNLTRSHVGASYYITWGRMSQLHSYFYPPVWFDELPELDWGELDQHWLVPAQLWIHTREPLFTSAKLKGLTVKGIVLEGGECIKPASPSSEYIQWMSESWREGRGWQEGKQWRGEGVARKAFSTPVPDSRSRKIY